MFPWAQGFHRLGYGVDHINEFGGFRRRHPGKLQTAGLDPHVFEKVGKQGEFASGVVITFQVMAFTRMSPGYPYAVGALPESGQNEFGAHPAGAGDADHPDVGRVLHTADAGQIRCAVAAPIAEKAYDFRFKFGH
jgi:hypothetical protein